MSSHFDRPLLPSGKGEADGEVVVVGSDEERLPDPPTFLFFLE
jgi:hypothetical protein